MSSVIHRRHELEQLTGPPSPYPARSSDYDRLSHLLAGQYIGLEEVAGGIWDVYYGTVRLDQMDERTFTSKTPWGEDNAGPRREPL